MRISIAATAGLILWAVALPAQDQPFSRPPVPGRYVPLDHNERPGKTAEWQLIAKPSLTGVYQPVRIELPSAGLVSFYSPTEQEPVLTQAPAQADMLIGPVYRIRISGLPEFPGVELYPTIELLDRLHPPPGREAEFPIPIHITRDEIETVLREQMVTKVIYLEAPQLASPLDGDERGILTYDAPAGSNLLETAGQLGRPMAILRLGGRTPDARSPQDAHFTRPAPIRIAPFVD